MRPDDVLAALRDDIQRVVTDSRWCFYDGHLPRGPNPDRVAGIEARDQFGRDGDDVSEAFRFDIGVASHRSRKAFQDSAWLITFLDMRLFATLVKLGVPLQPAYVVINSRSSLAEREFALSMSEWRVNLIGQVWDDAPRTWQKHARIPLADPRISPPSARAAADRAVRRLSNALSGGSTGGMATAEKLCWVCKIRPEEEKTGHRCYKCYDWHQKNRGTERPASLDAAELGPAYAAAARRRARGEGFGAA